MRPACDPSQRKAEVRAKLAVTFALPAESSEFLRRLTDKHRTDRNHIRTVRGEIGDRQIEVLHTGVGEKVCRERVSKFLRDQKFEVLISSGFAGALDDELGVGDVLLAKNFSTIDLNKRHLSFSKLPMRIANLVTVSALTDSSEARNRLARTSGAAAVDMETEFIARICAEHGTPLLSLRVITDTPRHPFPAPPHVLFNLERQKTDLLKLGSFFVTHPHRIPRVAQFARRIACTKKILANALVEVVREL
jgi:nucleoside phosphorylase